MIDILSSSTTILSKDTLSTIERISLYCFIETYELSLVFVDANESQSLNNLHRNKDNPTNILSFPLSDTIGEIIIDLETCASQHQLFERDFENFVIYLFIHGVMHLKGMDHGDEMEEAEKAVRKEFNI